MPNIRGLDPLTGEAQYLKVWGGDPANSTNSAVMEHADPGTHSRIDSMQSTLVEMDTSIDALRAEQIAVIKTDIADIKADVATIKADIATIKTSVANLESYQAAVFDSFATTQANRIVKASAGFLKSFYVRNRSASTTYYLMFFNRATAPAANATDFVLPSIVLDPGIRLAMGVSEFGDRGVSFATGLVYGISTSEDQYVAATVPSDIRMFVGYR